MKKLISIILCLVMVFSFAACSSDKTDGNENESEFEYITDNPAAKIVIKDYGTITVELRYDKAPDTVKNFIFLANSGFYNGLIFHRVIKDFMIQGGDPDGNGTGGPDYSIKGEFANNGFVTNDLAHTRGAIAMARSKAYDSAGSQFFICQTECSWLDGDYAVFGYVTDGIEIVDEIAVVDDAEIGGSISCTVLVFPYDIGKVQRVGVTGFALGIDE